MPLAASKQWRNFGRNGPATTLFAIAWPSYRPHRCPRSSFVAFSATPKFGRLDQSKRREADLFAMRQG
jgi:hypothetical protein